MRFSCYRRGRVLLLIVVGLLALRTLLFPLAVRWNRFCAMPAPRPAVPETSVACLEDRGACRLAAGETVDVTIVAKRRRNETGLFLLAGETYATRYVRDNGWTDGKYHATPTGVDFDWHVDLLAWWWTWLRPYPEGAWFQLVGRLDGRCGAFPVFGTRDSSIPFEFTAPADGELVLLVNDVIYRNNSGSMTLEISARNQSPAR